MKRIAWLDVLRGMCILFVIAVHTKLPVAIHAFMHSFIIPVFFFISGYLYNSRKYPDFMTLVKKKARTLLVPYVLLFMVTYLFWLLIGRRFGDDAADETDLLRPLIGMFYGNGHDGWLAFATPLWFLPCLFVVECLFYFIAKLETKKLLLALVVFVVIGYFDSLMPVRLPWSFDIALTVIVFYGIGYLMRRHAVVERLLDSPQYQLFLLMIAAFFVNLVLVHFNGAIDFNLRQYHHYVLMYGAAFCGILAWILVAHFLRFSQLLVVIGRHTLVLLAFHGIAFSVISAILVFIFNMELSATRGSLLWSMVYTIGATVILAPVAWVIDRYLPFMIGKSLKKKQTA